MGLLDALTSIAGGASPEHHGVADALSQVMQEHPGGMDGILNQLKQNGLVRTGCVVGRFWNQPERKSRAGAAGSRRLDSGNYCATRGHLSNRRQRSHRRSSSPRRLALF